MRHPSLIFFITVHILWNSSRKSEIHPLHLRPLLAPRDYNCCSRNVTITIPSWSKIVNLNFLIRFFCCCCCCCGGVGNSELSLRINANVHLTSFRMSQSRDICFPQSPTTQDKNANRRAMFSWRKFGHVLFSWRQIWSEVHTSF